MTDIAKFALNNMAQAAEQSIWKGMGTQAQANPTEKALATLYRFKCHKLGELIMPPNIFNDWCPLILAVLGKMRLISRRDICTHKP